MTRTFDLNQTGKELSELVALALTGTEVVLTRGETPLARLMPYESVHKPRIAGLNLGAMCASDDFDAPLPDDFWTGTP